MAPTIGSRSSRGDVQSRRDRAARRWPALGWLCTLAAVALGTAVFASLLARTTLAAEPPQTPRGWIERFEQAWDPDAWTGRAFGKQQFIRPMDDRAWQVRMQAMRSLVLARPASIEPLVEALQNGMPAVRILAAQTLTYLARDVPAQVLWQAATTDSEPAVRLYAVDALGMRGVGPLRQQLEARQKVEPNGDVRKHIGYALARSQPQPPSETDQPAKQPIDLIAQIRQWNPTTIDTARVGEPAPDFTLQSLTGETVSLGDFRGRQAVVLVFIYGDT